MSAHERLHAACTELDVMVQHYAEHSTAAAEAEADYKRTRAKRVLRARAEGTRSMAEAECIAEADDTVGDLLTLRLTTAAVADSTKQRITSLRERIGALRSYVADQRAADQLHTIPGRTP